MEDQKLDINEVCIAIDVDSAILQKVKNKEVASISLDITEDNYTLFLDNKEGNLVLTVDELPDTFLSCYYWNNGVFPYVVKKSLQFLVLAYNDGNMLVRINGVSIEAGQRFDFETGKSNPNGESCVWNITFDVEHTEEQAVRTEPKTYIMRWNPGISSSKIKDFCAARDKWPNGFVGDWSIYDWEEACEGDRYFMVRVGDGPNGIVYDGYFRSDPYEGEDWAGKGYKRHYVDISIEHPCHPDKPCVSVEQLEAVLPEICWRKGHSGELITKEQAAKLEILFNDSLKSK